MYGPVPSALFFTGGDQSTDDLIASVERGVYVATFNYCRVLDPKTMAVTGLTRNGTFMIENGQITGAVSVMRFTQSFLGALGPGNVARHRRRRPVGRFGVRPAVRARPVAAAGRVALHRRHRGVISGWHRARLVPVAEFDDRQAAEAAWAWLQEEDIPAVVESDPGALGGRVLTRVMVEKGAVDAAQRVIADHVRRT